MVHSLRELENDQTLLVQSGKPVGIVRMHPEAPRVLIANSNLVDHWSNDEQFHRMGQPGLTMYGQMTAGSWIYIGSQGIEQGTFETFAAAAHPHFGGTLGGRLIVSGGMGGAQPLAATLNGACFLGVEVDPARLKKRLKNGYCDRSSWSLNEALAIVNDACQRKQAISVGLVGNCADVVPELTRRGIVPDILTDQTRAHDVLQGYVPNGMPFGDARALGISNPDEYQRRALAARGQHATGMLALKRMGAVTFDHGNNIRGQAKPAGVENAFEIPGFVPEYIRPPFCEGPGPFRWVALSGSPADIHATGQVALELLPDNAVLKCWIRPARDRIQLQGLPARIGWQGYGERGEFGLAINDYVRRGKVEAPIVIGRDYLDAGSVASPYRGTGAVPDSSDAIADWQLLNALLNTAADASWVSIHNGGGVGIGYAQHAGMVVAADGTESCGRRLERVLTTDPDMGVIRHADPGYDQVVDGAHQRRIRLPMEPAQ
jgi:urocanate hydratase